MTKNLLMNTIFYSICVFLFSCTGTQQEKKIDCDNFENTKIVKNLIDNNHIEKMKSEIDSLIITCLMFGVDRDKSFVVKLNNSKLEWINFHNKKERINLTSNQLNELIDFVDLFYLKKQSIVISEKEEPSPASDYPIIEAIGYMKGKKAFDKKTTLYSNIDFNPKFLEFYEFLDGLVKEK